MHAHENAEQVGGSGNIKKPCDKDHDQHAEDNLPRHVPPFPWFPLLVGQRFPHNQAGTA